MFEETNLSGNSLFDSNGDGHLNAAERDHAECFLHDCDTFDQVIKKEGFSYNSHRYNNNQIEKGPFLIKVFTVLVIVCILDAILRCSY